MGCGGEEAWETYNLEDLHEFDVEVLISEDRPALVRFVITIPWICTNCVKSPLHVWKSRNKNVIKLYSRFTAFSDCTCYPESPAITGEISMWLHEGEYAVLAGETRTITFRIDAGSSEIISEKDYIPLPETD